jgi:hypothetical protein
MSFQAVTDNFVIPMRNRFTIPSGLDQGGFLADLTDALANFTPAQLDGAATWFRDNREVRAFPTIAECKSTCARMPREADIAIARKAYDRESNRKADEAVEFRRRIAAYKLCRCAMGREADHNGWLVALIEFCEENQRLPAGYEIDEIKAKAQRSADALDALQGPGMSPAIYAACSQFRRNMLDRAHTEVFDYRPKMTEAA